MYISFYANANMVDKFAQHVSLRILRKYFCVRVAEHKKARYNYTRLLSTYVVFIFLLYPSQVLVQQKGLIHFLLAMVQVFYPGVPVF